MTLREFFDWLGTNPLAVVGFFLGIPLTALLAGVLGRGEGHLSPWKYLYSALVFAACIPGIFSVAMSVYLFLFERGRLMEANIFTQILPVMSMFLTLFLVRRNVDFEHIPGFDRLSSLMMMIASIIVVMWLLDRTHIVAFSYIPISTLLLVVVGLLLLFRFGMKQLMR